MNINIDIRSRQVERAFERAPDVMSKMLRRSIGTAAQTMVRAAQKELTVNDSIFHSLLLQSLASRIDAPFSRTVFAGMKHGEYVENGTRPGGAPTKDEAEAWLKKRHNATGKDLDFRVRRLRKHIFENGTKARPFMRPAFEKNESRLVEILREGVSKGVAASFGS